MSLRITSTPDEFSVASDEHDEWSIRVNDDGTLTLHSYIGENRCSLYYGECRGADTEFNLEVPQEDAGDVIAGLQAWIEQLGKA